MNTKQLLEWAEIAKQVEAGSTRQFKNIQGEWRDSTQPDEWRVGNEYRIKPDPREGMNTIDEMIAVLQAIKGGRALQYRNIQPSGEWVDIWELSSAPPNFFKYEYRIKKVPREIWVAEVPGPDFCATVPVAGSNKHRPEWVLFREVLE